MQNALETILTTLKLNKKRSETPSARNKPLRRADPSLRDRSKPPPKSVVKEEWAGSNDSGNDSRDRSARDNRSSDNRTPPRSKDPHQERQHRPAGPDTRTTPGRKNRDEPQYRQSPRRGGKVRDGYDANAPTYGAAAKAGYLLTP
jgi:23S rRNA pseudouridine2604 synthase